MRWGLTYLERILARVKYDHGCWTYTGKQSAGGYGKLGVKGGGESQRTHRAVYEAINGPLAPGLELDHLCRNRLCCNPDHMEPVTHGENMRRGATGQYGRSGDDHWRRKRAKELANGVV